MKQLLITTLLLLLLGYLAWSFRGPESTSGAPAGCTGSPADGKSCTFCHGGTATLVPGLISSDVPVSGYVPGDTYNLSAMVSHATRVKFGFSLTPQNSFGVQLGTLRDTSVKTQLNGAGKYITHVGSGTSFPGGNAVWNFQWIAPVAGTGSVTFYGAFNLSNNLSNTGGDIIQTSTLSVTENTATSLGSTENHSNYRIFPNPVADVLHLDISGNSTTNTSYSVTDLTGKILITGDVQVSSTGNTDIHEVTRLSSGMYILEIGTNGQVAKLPFIKQ